MARVDVHLWAGLRRLTDGEEVVTVEASTIGEMLDAVIAKHPGVAPILEDGVSVALNGEIYTGNRHRAIETGDEVFLMQRMRGG
ncbi:MoaD/ThiS family protein [Mesobacterium pallidum]|uniref:MoaD/ThiS family protein n=1 Tax=Mesobacterium pallidum TaxID=2872037 RepID=UPI001EE24199|nr:MoaD/ThiS family protein [Mesobacterium pallidum]